MIRLAVCLDDSPTMLYSEKVLTKGRTYHVEVESRGVGGLVRVLDPDPVVLHEVKQGTQKVRGLNGGVYDEPTYTLTGNVAKVEPRAPIRMSADRFQILNASGLLTTDALQRLAGQDDLVAAIIAARA